MSAHTFWLTSGHGFAPQPPSHSEAAKKPCATADWPLALARQGMLMKLVLSLSRTPQTLTLAQPSRQSTLVPMAHKGVRAYASVSLQPC